LPVGAPEKHNQLFSLPFSDICDIILAQEHCYSKGHVEGVMQRQDYIEAQCLGISGISLPCLLAIEAILDSKELPKRATIVTYVKSRGNSQEQHLILFDDWCRVPLTVVKSGFASGYPGEAPKAFSLAICMIRSKDIPIYGFEADMTEFRLIEHGQVDKQLYRRIMTESELLTWPWPLWILNEHEALLGEGKLWKGLYWRGEKSDWLTKVIGGIAEYNPVAGKKLRLAVDQLEGFDETEQLQQIGILLRDGWIEFTQKIWAGLTNMDKSGVGPNDVKGMLTKSHLDNEPVRIASLALDMANKVQHDRNATFHFATACVVITVLAMDMLMESAKRNEMLSRQTYYKCPRCGSIELSVVTKGTLDFDGVPIPMDYLVCNKCKWEIEETGLTTPPF
ncbi:MAG: hypothetical protein KAW83_05570, partial [Dehalococcoidia bacterium]|nr:hypothetical protein [Dehalococcoidia bacterium]